jgi:SSS family solute:Na+ symporter
MHASSIMDYCQALFSFFIAPLFGTVLLGMLWKRATPAGGFWGLTAGISSSVGMWVWTKIDPSAVKYVALSAQAQDQAQNMFRALWCWLLCVIVTVLVSLVTKPKPEAELSGLVMGATKIPPEGAAAFWQKPIFWAGVTTAVFVIVNVYFW